MKEIKIACTGTELVDFHDLNEFQEDIKTIKRENLEKLKNSIKGAFKFPFAIWYYEDEYWILDGHQRLKALIELEKEGWEIPPLPAVQIFENTKEEAKAAVLELTSQHGEFSKKALGLYIKKYELNPVNIVLRHKSLVLKTGLKTESDDSIPEEASYITKPGDLWELGSHRLMCGDSREDDQVEKLTGGHRVDLVHTDPPYGVDIVQSQTIGKGGPAAFGKIGAGGITHANTYKEIKGDHTTETAKCFYNLCINRGYENLILWGGNHYTDFLPVSPRWIVWDKKAMANFTQAEMAWTSFETGGVSVYTFMWHGMSREGNRVDELKSRVYPTQKPVGLFVDILSEYPDLKYIFDGFIGSGSTLIAAEKIGRVCFAMDLEEYSCDIVAKRYYNWCKANDRETVIKLNGKEIDYKILEK